jgi:hypothetical protein
MNLGINYQLIYSRGITLFDRSHLSILVLEYLLVSVVETYPLSMHFFRLFLYFFNAFRAPLTI